MAKDHYNAKTGELKAVEAEVKATSSEEKAIPKEQPAVVKDSAYYRRMADKYRATADELRKKEEEAARKKAADGAAEIKGVLEKKLADSEAARVAFEKEANEAKSKIAELFAKIRDDEKKITSLGAELSGARKKIAVLETDNEKLTLAMVAAEDEASKIGLENRRLKEKVKFTEATEVAIQGLVEETKGLKSKAEDFRTVALAQYNGTKVLVDSIDKLAATVQRSLSIRLE